MERLLNEKVIHIKFGVGSIIGIGNEKITIKFEKLEENKSFQYPDGFECFLRFENRLLQESVLKQLKDKKAKIGKEQKRLEFNRQYEEHKKEERKLKKKTKKVTKER